MTAPSPFLPDAQTLTALFANAGITADAGSVSPAARAATSARSAGSSAGLPPIRFPGTPTTVAVPGKGPARAAIPPLPAVVAPPTPPAAPRPTVAATPSPTSELQNDEVALRQIFGRDQAGSASLQRRLDGFVEWLGAAVGASGAFVADADGLVLATRNAPEGYVVATASLSHAEQTVLAYLPRPAESATTMELDETSFLQVIRIDTGLGRMIVGLIVTSPLSRAACAMVRRLLRLGVEGEPGR